MQPLARKNIFFLIFSTICIILTVYFTYSCRSAANSDGDVAPHDEVMTPRSDKVDGSARIADLASTVAAMYKKYKAADFAEVPDISAKDLIGDGKIGKIGGEDQSYLLLDCRTPAERAVSMLPGAVSVEQYESNRDHYAGRKMVVYCTIGYRSGLFARKLNQEGVVALNLKGGVLAWALAGGVFVDPATGEDTKRVHVYGRKWDLLPPGYEAVY